MSKTGLRQIIPFVVLAFFAVGSLFFPTMETAAVVAEYNTGDITWVLISTALVFLMTPGLSFFYGGMVNRKNVLSTMIKSFVATGIISVLWIFVGYSMSFGRSVGGWIGNPMTHLFYSGVLSAQPWFGGPTIPLSLFSIFQLMFAIITPALVVGALAERIKFLSYVLFIILFAILIYFPVCHWAWHPDGLLFKMGVLDFAGGTVVHITAGCAALAGALVLKRRKSHLENQEAHPANVPYVLIGTGLLWFGWFGFNGGSALGANGLAVSAFTTTNLAAATAGLSWMFFDIIRGKKSAGVDGLYFGNIDFFLTQLKGMVLVSAYSFVVAYIIFKVINLINPIRVSEDEEELGLDASQHGENYVQGTLLVKKENKLTEVVNSEQY
ncbi:MAG: ammonium transporter [Saprospiraceae bacterium]|nr:ammonium transporter [Saprospiraceae bacterium]